MSDEDAEKAREFYGRNEINVEVPTVWKIFYYEIFNPFYVFQVFSFILWFVDEYVFYASTIVITTLTSVVLLVYSIFKVKVKF